MNERILTQHFREAWLRMDTSDMSGFMSDTLRFSSIARFSSFKSKQEFLEHAARVFHKLKANRALTIPGARSKKKSFGLTYQYESLVPVSHYMITSNGFGLVSCLEYRIVSLDTIIKLRFKEQLISEIKIFQKKNIECRNTAFHSYNFASSTRNKPREDEN